MRPLQAEASNTRLPATSRAVILLGAALVAAVLAVTTYEIWRQRATTLRAAEQQLASLSLALAGQTERAFQSVELVLKETADKARGGVDRGLPGTRETHEELRERIVGIPQVLGLVVADAHGDLVAASRSDPPPSLSIADWDVFLRQRDDPAAGLFIGAPARSPVDGHWLIPVSRRLDGPGGAFDGVAMAALDPAYFEQVYAKVLPPAGGAFALYRGDAVLLVRQPHVEEAVGQSFSSLRLFSELVPSAPAGTYRTVSPIDHALRMVSYNMLGRYPLLINVSVDERILLDAWRGNAIRLSLAAFLATMVLTGAVAVLVRQMRREEAQAGALKASQQRLSFAQFALDHAADMVFWITPDARILYANHAACDRLGWEPAEMALLSVGDIDTRFAFDKWPRQFQVVREKKSVRFESEHQTRDGRSFPTEVAANYVAFGGEEYACAFVRDISERKQAEATLAERTVRLEASNAELEQFAYVASHDLREPLRMVNSFVAMLARRYGDRLDDQAREFIAFAQEGATRMDRLILDLLEYSRVGRLDRPLAPVGLDHLAEMAVKGLGLRIIESGAVVTVAPNLPLVQASEEELVRLLINLIGNALKYRHPERRPEVRVGAERRGDEVVVWVADNGIGIAPQYFDRIFRIFQRLHGRDKYDGTGIGLAICKKIVERHGGRIWVESEPDGGATFLFTLKAV